MKTILFLLVSTTWIWASAQENFIFDTSKIDAKTKLIGRYPSYDKQKTHKKFNFIIEDPEIIKRVIMTLPLGEEEPNIFTTQNFWITIVQDFREVKTWMVNPSLNNVLADGRTFAFEVNKLKKLSKAYPFDYRFEIIPFSNEVEFKSHLEKQKVDTSFLFYYRPAFKYEGSFEIEFPNNDTFSSPLAISEYLKPMIEKIVTENEYSINYVLDDKNKNDQFHYTMIINGSKKLYDQLKLENLNKENWKKTVENGYFFYRTR